MIKTWVISWISMHLLRPAQSVSPVQHPGSLVNCEKWTQLGVLWSGVTKPLNSLYINKPAYWQDHLKHNNLYERFQSGFRPPTALKQLWWGSQTTCWWWWRLANPLSSSSLTCLQHSTLWTTVYFSTSYITLSDSLTPLSTGFTLILPTGQSM